MRLRGIGHSLILVMLLGCLGGCFPGGGRLDEEQDSHFQRGRNLAGGQDFNGAAQEFETALENNPRSAVAHFELGWLCDTKLNDPAAAVYHYEQHLRLQPDSPRSALVQERIRGCKQQLANSEFPLPNTRNLQKDVDRLNAENQTLKQQLEALKTQLAYAIGANQGRTEPARYTASPGTTTTTAAPRPGVPAAGRTRVHVVQAHETLMTIAAQYGVKVSNILAANPQVNPKRLRIGQSLNVP